MKTSSNEWAKFIAAPELGMQGLHAYFNKHQYERHSHDYYVLGTIDAGAPKVALENTSFIAPAGSAMIINPGDSHDGKACGDQGYLYSMVYVEPWAIADIAGEFGVSTPASILFTRSVVTDPDVVFALRRLHRTLFYGQDRLAAEIHLIEALKPLLTRYSTRPVTLKTKAREPRIERVRELIHECYANSLTTADMAEAAGLSRVRLNQLFRAAYGLPLHAYLNGVRLEAAKKLLISGLPSAGVAASVGLFDQSHLIRRFKGCFGITPAQFVDAHFPVVQYGTSLSLP
jgi:AraC-like DNA-binding protein